MLDIDHIFNIFGSTTTLMSRSTSTLRKRKEMLLREVNLVKRNITKEREEIYLNDQI